MAEEELDAGGQKKGGALKLIIIVVLLLVVLGGAAVALRFVAPGLIPGWGEKPQAASSSGGKKTDKGAPPVESVQLALKPFIVNLADRSGKRYLKLTISMELAGEEAKTLVNKRLPQIRDSVLILLSSLTFDDISTVEGKMRLRTQIVSRCNTYLEGKLRNVYFTEFVVQ